MKIFIALLLFNYLVQVSYSFRQSIDPKFTAEGIAADIIKGKQSENISNNSDIDNNPQDYIVLSADQLKESKGAKGDEYYPGPNAKYEPPTNSQAFLRKSFNYYKKDPKPYYGVSKTDFRIVSETPEGIKVPVEYKDLNDIQGTQDHLDSLKERLAALHITESTPNREYVGNAAVYEKDPKPYYDPLKNVHEEKEKYLKGVIAQVEGMLNSNIETTDVKYERVKVGEVIYQNSQNKEAEIYNEILEKNRPSVVITKRKEAISHEKDKSSQKKEVKETKNNQNLKQEAIPLETKNISSTPLTSTTVESNQSNSEILAPPKKALQHPSADKIKFTHK